MYSNKVAMALLPLIAAISASPIERVPEKRSSEKVARQSSVGPTTTLWTSPDGSGNVQLFFSDGAVNYGTTNPVDLINQYVASSCLDSGTCDSASVSCPSSYVSNGIGPETNDISYVASGVYPSWIHNGLVEALVFAMQNQTTVNPNACWSPSASECDPEAYCPAPTTQCETEYTGPSTVGVVGVGDSWDTQDPPTMQVTFTVQTENGAGICSTVASAGAAIAGAVPDVGGPGAALFSLAGLLCTA